MWTIIEDLKKTGKRRIAISGNPGIGKTCFLAYVFYQLKKQGNCTIILDIRSTARMFCFTSTSVTEGDKHHFRQLLDDPSTIYIVDGGQPINRPAFTLLASSPRPDNYKEFLKYGEATQRWMPVWTLAELETCRGICFPDTLSSVSLFSSQ
jgi:hypothetical protein